MEINKIKMAWIESMNSLSIKNIKIGALLSLKALSNFYYTMRCLPIGENIFLLANPIFLGYLSYLNLPFGTVLIGAFMLNLVKIVIAGLRPSVELKNADYFLYYKNDTFLIALIGILVFFLQYSKSTFAILSPLFTIFFIFDHIYIPYITNSAIIYALSPLIIFILLFLMDSRFTLDNYCKALLRAIGMVIYNYPVCVILYISIRLIMLALIRGIPFLLSYFITPGSSFLTSLFFFSAAWYIFIFFILLPYLSILTNLYIKAIHNHFLLYYKN
jgi:hypothetical protein